MRNRVLVNWKRLCYFCCTIRAKVSFKFFCLPFSQRIHQTYFWCSYHRFVGFPVACFNSTQQCCFFVSFVKQEENPTIIGPDLIVITDILLKTESDYVKMLATWLLAHLVVNGKIHLHWLISRSQIHFVLIPLLPALRKNIKTEVVTIAVISTRDVLPKVLESLGSGEKDLVLKAVMFVNNLSVQSTKEPELQTKKKWHQTKEKRSQNKVCGDVSTFEKTKFFKKFSSGAHIPKTKLFVHILKIWKKILKTKKLHYPFWDPIK